MSYSRVNLVRFAVIMVMLSLAACAGEKQTPSNAERVNFETDDGVKIVADFYPAATAPAPAVLALHQFNGNRSTYQQLAGNLQKKGIAVLAIDGRGFGESTESKNGKLSPTPTDQPDVIAAIKFLRANKAVQPDQIGIIGASYGSSNAIIYAGDDPQIRAVALLSPGLNYFDKLPTVPAVKKYGARPLLIVAGEKDNRSDPQDARSLDQIATGQHELKMLDTDAHGTDILTSKPEIVPVIETFFEKNLKK